MSTCTSNCVHYVKTSVWLRVECVKGEWERKACTLVHVGGVFGVFRGSGGDKNTAGSVSCCSDGIHVSTTAVWISRPSVLAHFSFLWLVSQCTATVFLLSCSKNIGDIRPGRTSLFHLSVFMIVNLLCNNTENYYGVFWILEMIKSAKLCNTPNPIFRNYQPHVTRMETKMKDVNCVSCWQAASPPKTHK